jgi:hypothetical protein
VRRALLVHIKRVSIRAAPSFDSFLDRVHPSDRKRVAETMTDAMDRAASYETEFRVLGYDEIERWVLAKGKAMRRFAI